MFFDNTKPTKDMTAGQRAGYRIKLILFIAPFVCLFLYLAGHNERVKQHEVALGKVHNLTVADALPAYLPRARR
jgi:hypothetical protein